MKITINIDDALLDKAVEVSGASTKTAAVDFALRELVRRGTLQRILDEGLGLTPDELANAIDPDYDLMAFRAAETPGKKYGDASGSGR